MKTLLRHFTLLTGLVMLSMYCASAQTNINDESFREKGMNDIKQKLLQAAQACIDEIDGLVEKKTDASQKEKSDDVIQDHDKGFSYSSICDDLAKDSTKKHNAIRQQQEELRRELQELQSKAADLQRKLDEAKTGDHQDLQKDLRKLARDMESLQRRLDKIQRKSERDRRRIEDKYIGNSNNVTRFNDDFILTKEDVMESNVVVNDGDAIIQGTINGKLIVTNGDVVLGESAVIKGDVVCMNGDVTRDEKAVVEGKIFEKDKHSFAGSYDFDDDDEDHFDNFYQKYPGTIASMFPLRSPLEESFVRYNRVEGLYIGIAEAKKLYWINQPALVGTGSLGYGFTSHTWRYSLGLYKPFYLENQIVEFGSEGHSLTDSKDQWIVGREENSLMAFFGREDFLDYFTRRGFSVSLGWYGRFDHGVQTRVTAAYQHDTYRNMEKGTDWSLFGGDKIFRVNPMINESNINSFFMTAGLSTVRKSSRQIEGWDMHAAYEVAGGATKGDYNFTQIIFDARHYQPLWDFMNINLRARAGASSGSLPIQRTFEFGGISTLPGYRFKELRGSHILLGNAELIINSNLMDRSRGWASWFFNSINLILFSDFGITNTPTYIVARDFTSGSMEANFLDGFTSLSNNSVKSDAGIAVSSADGDFRIGMAWRLDKPSSPNFILRFTRPF